MSNTKDVHRTGALAAVLSQGLVTTASNKLGNVSKSNRPSLNENLTEPTTNNTTSSLLLVSPDECVPWKFADRSFFEMGDIKALAESIAQSGQQEPGLVRPIHNNNQPFKYEIIFGNRRWQACKLISSPFLVIVKTINDQDAALYQKEENSHRKDISDYSKALYYKKLLDEHVFESEAELSRKLGVARSRVNDLLSYTRVPESLRNRLPNFHKLSQRMVIKLASLAKTPTYLETLLGFVDEIDRRIINHNNVEHIVKHGMSDEDTYSKMTIVNHQQIELFSMETKRDGSKSILLNKNLSGQIKDSEIVSVIKEYILSVT